MDSRVDFVLPNFLFILSISLCVCVILRKLRVVNIDQIIADDCLAS